MEQSEIELLANELGEALGDAVLYSLSPSEVARFKREFDLEEIENVEQEYFYLMMFLATYSCQIAFIGNQRFARVVLDRFNKYMAENKFNLLLQVPDDQELQEKLRKRYAQYYDLSRNKEFSIDVGFLAKQLPYDFFANVLEKDLHYIFNEKDFRERWGQSTLKLGLLVGEYLTELALAISTIKDKYKI